MCVPLAIIWYLNMNYDYPHMLLWQ